MNKVNSSSIILNGRDVSNEVLKNLRIEVKELTIKNKRPPGLSVIMIGENPASETYVRNKGKACVDLGYYSKIHKLANNTTEKELSSLIKELNKEPSIDGILVQLPLPVHINYENIVNSIDPNKDVDGLNPYNLGKLLSGQDCLKPCTPIGIIEIFKYYSINLTGAHIVIVGRSTLVGKPLAALLLKENATVTIAHSKSVNIQDISKKADMLICAIGRPKLITKQWVNPNSIVIDVGINKIIENGTQKLVGDVDFEDVSKICKAITPVPGGVGPVTIAMLMKNTMLAYKKRENCD